MQNCSRITNIIISDEIKNKLTTKDVQTTYNLENFIGLNYKNFFNHGEKSLIFLSKNHLYF